MEAVEARYVSGVFLHRGSQRPLHEAVKVKYRLCLKPHGIGDARIIVYLPKELLLDCGLR